ncbi:hypothetical protein AVEN_87816-1 [Araneus ventricosus]|uniref:Uncharacterized protein n=1 Tax=Araneus ventricosus TaxID=182803 RepID=A0A4Y2BDA5_ARAVE|nr:hypothetical protein AVEN_87816-1 [Araneus ventricosus]
MGEIGSPGLQPDLAPSNFQLFPAMKSALSGRHFRSNGKVRQDVKNFLRSLATDFYHGGFLNEFYAVEDVANPASLSDQPLSPTSLDRCPENKANNLKHEQTILLYHIEKANSRSMKHADVLNILKNEIRNDTINVKSIKKLRNDGVAINCAQQDDIDLILKEINDSPILKENVRPVPKRLPKSIVYGLDPDILKESIEAAISRISGPNSFKVLFSIKGRTNKFHWVFEADSTLYHTIKKQ